MSFFFTIIEQSNQRIMPPKVKYSLLIASGKKAAISYEWCACFDSDSQHAARVDGVRGVFFSYGSMPKH